MPLALEKKLPVILLLASLMLAAISYFSYQSTQSLKKAVGWEKHTQDVLLKLDEALLAATDVETSGRGFVISGTDNFLAPFNTGRQNAQKALEDLNALMSDNPAQAESLVQLNNQINEKISITESYIETRRAGGLLTAVNEVSRGEGDAKMNQIRRSVQKLKTEEARLLKFREENVEHTLDNNFWMMLVSSIAGISALAMANFVVLLEIKRRRHAETDLVLANQSLERRVEERTDELRMANDNLKESEIFSRSVIDSLSAHVAVLDKDGRIILVNNAWENFAEANAGIEQLSQTGIGQNYLSVCEQESEDNELQIVAENLRAILDGERTHFTIEYPCHSASEERWFLMQVNALQDTSGGVVVSHYNITDRVKAELNERKARRDAEIANRLRDEFMATVSHELRTPLNAILGWAKILKSGRADAENSARAVETIIKNAETQNRLIEDLMDVARIVSGKLILEREPVSAEEFVTTSVETIKPTAGEKSIAVNLTIADAAKDKTISGDPNRLRQILLNLLTNAVKFTPEGGKIDVSLTNEQNRAVVRVKDNGAGISPEFLPFVFERFRQDEATVEKSGGLGLGLAIVRQLTELHGGRVHVESEGENKGATFTVQIPFAGEN
ncbi:MAG TPA: CHASE3 domain-containing protein [Pyrinomonadaceae bacterium]|jgi:signal transduction histidine kinase/CHASE3 domain sensor protein